MINDKRITPLPIMLIAVFDNDLLKRPFIKNPIKGKNGTRKIKLIMPCTLKGIYPKSTGGLRKL